MCVEIVLSVVDLIHRIALLDALVFKEKIKLVATDRELFHFNLACLEDFLGVGPVLKEFEFLVGIRDELVALDALTKAARLLSFLCLFLE